MATKTKTDVKVYHNTKTNTLGNLRAFLDPRAQVYVHFTSKPRIDSEGIKKLDKEIERRPGQVCQFMDINHDYDDDMILLMYNSIIFHDYMIKPIIVMVIYIPEEENNDE